MTGKPLYNWPAFEEAAEKLRAEGHEVVSPADIDEAEGWVDVRRTPEGWIYAVTATEDFDFRTAIGRDLDEVETCDAVYMLPGWSESVGAKIERNQALALNKDVLYAPGAELPSSREEAGQPSPPAEDTWASLPERRARVEADEPVAPLPRWSRSPVHGDPVPDIEGRDIPSSEKYPPFRRLLDERPEDGPYEPEAVLRNFTVSDTPQAGEVRVVDPKTGGAKGSKLAQLGAVDPESLLEVARVAGFGGQKYDRFNFAKGYKWSLSYDALARHFLAWLGGEELDPESGLPHLAHAAWHCLALRTFERRGRGTDDRLTAFLDALPDDEVGDL